MCDFLSIEIRSWVFKVNGVENGDKVGFGESVESGLEEVFLGVEVFVHMFSQSQMLFLGGKELLLEHCALVDELGEGWIALFGQQMLLGELVLDWGQLSFEVLQLLLGQFIWGQFSVQFLFKRGQHLADCGLVCVGDCLKVLNLLLVPVQSLPHLQNLLTQLNSLLKSALRTQVPGFRHKFRFHHLSRHFLFAFQVYLADHHWLWECALIYAAFLLTVLWLSLRKHLYFLYFLR
jgi:hypothetical protein